MQTFRIAALLFAATAALATPTRALEVPVDIGVGPAAHWVTGPIGDDQLGHFGLKLSLAAVLDRALIQRNLDRVPPRYRKLAGSMDEVRYRPSLLIPDSLTISPKLWHTGMYGITWRPVALAMPLSHGPSKLTFGAGVLLNYSFIHTDRAAELGFSTMHFLRPGVDLTLRWEIPVLPSAFLVAVGWSSQIFVPQKLGGSVLAIGGFDRGSIWHVGQVFLTLHWRIPYEVRM